MRMYSKAALVCLVLATQACTLTLPNGLVRPAGGTGGSTGGGNVSGNESCTALFFKLDTNSDGELTEDEYVRGRMGNVKAQGGEETTVAPATGRPPSAEEKRQVQDVRTIEDDIRAGFKALDVDGNGRVTRDEFLVSCDGANTKPPTPPIATTVPGHPPVKIRPDADCGPEFGQYDANQDGKWDRGEYERFAGRPIPMIAQCVTPGTGLVSNNGADLVSNNDGREVTLERDRAMVEPVCGTPPQYMTHPFEKYDLNQDGAIDGKEFCSVQGSGTIAPPPPVNWDCKDTFVRADVNQDGRVDLEEYRRADYSPPPPDGMARPAVMPSDEEMMRRFQGMDQNGDKSLTPDEFCGWGTKPLPTPTPTPFVGGPCEEELAKMDRNRDGSVTWEEFYREPGPNENVDWATYKDSYYAKFKSYDRDGDQKIHAFEYCGGGTIEPEPVDKCTMEFREFDRDGSGFVSFDEYAGGRYNQINFIQAPSQEEAAKFIYDFKARARNFDMNRDEQLSLEEFRKACY